ncbi:MAG: paraslipin [Spirochaetales bacterium]|nr:MAG: paraslipin [Spirochaetales bacterium]
MGVVGSYLLTASILVFFFLVFFKLIRIVPEQEAWVVEEFGKFKRILGPGLHLLIPVVQKVAYRNILKEEVIDVSPQVCITRDNAQVSVDGILYIQIVDPERASYGIENYRFAAAQLAQTTMRSEIGKIELDNTFSERESINDAIVRSVDQASEPWGIKVTRYEIRDITPTDTALTAMEQLVIAEREKRAAILESEGSRESGINRSKGARQHEINISEGNRQRQINVAEGRAQAIEVVATATAEGIVEVAKAIELPKGKQAVSLRIAEQFIAQLGDILDQAETQVLPFDIANIKALFDTVTGKGGAPSPEPESRILRDRGRVAGSAREGGQA